MVGVIILLGAAGTILSQATDLPAEQTVRPAAVEIPAVPAQVEIYEVGPSSTPAAPVGLPVGA